MAPLPVVDAFDRLTGLADDGAPIGLLLDYDGTLVDLQLRPELAAPDEALLELLERLTERPGTEVHVVSGRRRVTLDDWLGALPIGLHAEHGLWSRQIGEPWHARATGSLAWRDPVRTILQHAVARTPKSWLEEKTAGLAWHVRQSETADVIATRPGLDRALRAEGAGTRFDLIEGKLVLEAQPHGVHKGRVSAALAARDPARRWIAIGDDATDEALFRGLPADGLAVKVGEGLTRAEVRLTDPAAVRGLLASLL